MLTGLVIFVIRHMPWRVRRGLAHWIGTLAARRHAKRRQAAQINLDLAFGDSMSAARKEEVALKSFQHFAECLFDAFAMVPRLSAANWHRMIHVPEEDLVMFRDHLREGNGVLVMFAHFGNWELMGNAMSFMDLAPINAVAKRQSAWSNPFIERLRTATGNRVIYKEGAVRKTLSALKRGEIVGLAIDQNFSQGVFVPFFGIEAGTPDTLAALARTSGAPIIAFTCLPNGDGTYRGHFLPAIHAEHTRDKAADIRATTRKCLETLEEMIRQNPDMWLWSHKRWKSRPPDEEPKRDLYNQNPGRDRQASKTMAHRA